MTDFKINPEGENAADIFFISQDRRQELATCAADIAARHKERITAQLIKEKSAGHLTAMIDLSSLIKEHLELAKDVQEFGFAAYMAGISRKDIDTFTSDLIEII